MRRCVKMKRTARHSLPGRIAPLGCYCGARPASAETRRPRATAAITRCADSSRSEVGMRSLTWKDVWSRRLARHALLTPRPKEDLVEVVRAVGGIHAQMLPAAE